MRKQLRVIALTMMAAMLMTLGAGSLYAADPGNALSFDGVNDYVRVSDIVNMTDITNYTVEGWFNCPAENSGTGWVISNGLQLISLNSWKGGGLRFGGLLVGSPGQYTDGSWHHFAAVCDLSQNKAMVYIDGKLAGSGSPGNSSSINVTSLLLGSINPDNPTDPRFLKGKLDEIRIWKVARTEAEILSNMRKSLAGDEANLLAYYNFDETSGTALPDVTGNGNDGTLTNGPKWVASGAVFEMTAPGNALTFDGTNDYVTIGNVSSLSFNGTLPYTIEAWVKPRIGGSGGYILSRFRSGIAATYTLSITSDGKLRSTRNTAPWSVVSHEFIPFGEYTHVATTYDGTTLRIYINGKDVGNVLIGACSSSEPLLIGARLNASGIPESFFDGEIDEIRFWNISRSVEQIQADMHRALNGNETGLAGYYRFDHKSGTTLTDLTANGNHGTLKNMDNTDWVASGAMCPFIKTVTDITADGFTGGWDAVTGATGYLADVDDNADFSSPMKTDADAGTGTSGEVVGLNLSPETLYYWRMRAQKGDWTSPNSAASSFMMAPGNALKFDGTDDYVDAPAAFSETLTLEAWIKPDSISSYQNILSYGDSGNSSNTAEFRLTPEGKIEYGQAQPGVGWQNLVSKSSIESEVWNHVSMVKNGSNVSLYINGVLDKTASITNFPTLNRLYVGCRRYLGVCDQNFKGSLDEIRVWNTARTEIQILQGMNKPLAGNESGLVTYYNFDQTGGTVLPDVTGQGRNGTLTSGPVYAASGAMSDAPVPPNNALSFAGSDDYVQMNDVKLGTSDFTIEGWIKPNTSAGQGYVYTNRTKETDSKGNWFTVGLYGSKVFVEFAACASSYKSFVSKSSLASNIWYHIALVRNQTTVTLYVNGVQEVQFSDNASLRNLTAGTSITRFGGWPDYNAKWYKGQIDEFRVWNTARTSTEISEGMSKTLDGSETGLVAYYNFNQSGTALSDVTGHGHDGTLKNGPIWVASPVPTPADTPQNAMLFDGTDDYALSPGFITLTGNDSMTISAWVKPAAIKEAMFASVGESAAYLGIGMDGSGNFISKSESGANNSGFSLKTGVWYHLTAVFSGGQSTLYVNGVKSGSAGACANKAGSNMPVVIGKNMRTGACFNGEMDEVCIWNTARTQEEIRSTIGRDVSGQAGLIAYYTFDQGTAAKDNTGITNLADIMGANNAALNNFILIGTSSNFVLSGVIFEPTRQASALKSSDVTAVSATLSWTNGNGENRIVIVKADTEIEEDPMDRTSYNANAAFGAGSQIGAGGYVVYSGTESSVNITGLDLKNYYAAVYEFNGSGSDADYLTISPAALGFSTLPKTVTVSDVSPVGATAVVASAAAEGFLITERGFSVNSELYPAGSGEGDYSLTITGLKPRTGYNILGYIKVDGEIIYSDPFSVTTGSSDAGLVPAVHTDTGNYTIDGSSIRVAGSVEAIGISAVTSYGFLYGNHANLGSTDQTVTFAKTIDPDVSFSSALKNLAPGTYWVRAYASNIVGMGLGEEFSFTIETVAPKLTTSPNPKVTTVSEGKKTVTMRGGIIDPGNIPVVVWGFVYADHENPTIWDNVLVVKDLPDPITAGIFFEGTATNIPSGTYYFKAFAYSSESLGYADDSYSFSPRQIRDNEENVSYGQEFSFTIRDDASLSGSVPGDVNGDGQTGIADAVLALQIAADVTPVQDIRLSGDVNGDKKIGTEEAVFILQESAEYIWQDEELLK
jgi:hypothetical protein